MLYKVWATKTFADTPDRIGVIEADSLDAAIAELKAWSDETLVEADYEQVGGAEITRGDVWAEVSFPVRDTSDGYTGRDSYMLVPVDAKRLMFHAEDWMHHFA